MKDCCDNMTTLDQTVEESYGYAKGNGFHDEPAAFRELQMLADEADENGFASAAGRIRAVRQELLAARHVDTFNTKLVLIHSEVSEALEEYRAGKPALYYVQDKHNKAKPEGWGVELIDAFIRIADLLGMTGQSLQELYDIKKKYNAGREYKHGKAY